MSSVCKLLGKLLELERMGQDSNINLDVEQESLSLKCLTFHWGIYNKVSNCKIQTERDVTLGAGGYL